MTPCDLDVDIALLLRRDGAGGSRARGRASARLRRRAGSAWRICTQSARALAARPAVDAPPAGDWSGSCAGSMARSVSHAVASHPAPVILEHDGRTVDRAAVVAPGRDARAGRDGCLHGGALQGSDPLAIVQVAPASWRGAATRRGRCRGADESRGTSASLREVSVEHLERSKLVVLGLTTRDPSETTADDWQYERDARRHAAVRHAALPAWRPRIAASRMSRG